MEFEEIFQLIDAAVVAKEKRHLKDIEVAILRGSWQRQKYHEIAQTYGYTAEYLKQDVGPKLWKLLSEVLGEKVSKTNFQAALERLWLLSNGSTNLAQTSTGDNSWQLPANQIPEIHKIFSETGAFSASEDEWKVVIKHYAGNPLALKIVATLIRDLENKV